jgi:hypothetical protein
MRGLSLAFSPWLLALGVVPGRRSVLRPSGVWWLAAARQWVAVAARLMLLWLAVLQPAAAPGGVAMLGLGVMVKLLRSERRRPREAAIVGAEEIQAALTGTAIERRLGTRVDALALAALLWAFIQTI